MDDYSATEALMLSARDEVDDHFSLDIFDVKRMFVANSGSMRKANEIFSN